MIVDTQRSLEFPYVVQCISVIGCSNYRPLSAHWRYKWRSKYRI